MKFYYKGQKRDFSQEIFLRPCFFGEAPFTSLRSFSSVFPFWEDHVCRLKESCLFLFGPSYWKDLENQIKEGIFLIEKENPQDKYLKIMLIPSFANLEDNWKLLPETFDENQLKIEVFLCTKPMTDNSIISPKLLKLSTVSTNETFVSDKEFFLKLGSYAKTLKYLKEVRSKGFHDYLRLNSQGILGDSSTSSFFFIEDLDRKIISTPRLGPQVLDGIWRKNILKILKELSWNIKERDIYIHEIMGNTTNKMNGIFLTNSVKGIAKVECFQDIYYNNNVYDFLNKVAEKIHVTMSSL